MEKIKNLLNPGKAADNEQMYDSGNPSDTATRGNTGTLSGEGSHFGNTRDTTTGTGLGASNVGDSVNPGPAPTTAGPHTTDLGNKMDPRVDSNLDGSRIAGNTTGAVGSTGASSMPASSMSQSTNPYSTRDVDPRLGGATTTTGPGMTGTTTGQSGLVGDNTTGNTGNNFGRDAAAVGTAGAVGEGIHHHRENERQNVGTTGYGAPVTDFGTQGSNITSANTSTDPALGANTTSTSTTGPHSSNLLNKLDPRVKPGDYNTTGTTDATGTTGSGHHYGRDAAAVGGAAAVGEGIHHHRENERERERENLGTSGYSGTTPSGAGSSYYGGPAGTAVSGPHTTSTANRLDPTVNRSAAPIEDASVHHPLTGGGGESADAAHGTHPHHLGRDAAVGAGGVGLTEHEHHRHERERERETGLGSNTGAYGDDTTTTGTSGHHHHLGRDAAIGAGGVGLAEHEHRKHERERETGVGSNTGIGSNTGAYGDDTTTTGGHHHLGRDAAVGAGGVGAVGLAEHEHRKHEREREAEAGTGTGVSSLPGPAPNTAGPHSKDWMNRLDPRVDSNPDTATTGSTSGYDRSEQPTGHHYGRDAAAVGAAGVGAAGLTEHERLKREAARNQPGNDYGQDVTDPNYGTTTTGHHGGHHLGRDAAGAGVVGGAAYEAEKHHKHDKDLTAEERENKRKHKAEEKEARREHKEEKKHGGGLLSFLHRDKNKKYTKEEEDEFDRQEREHNRHTGRDAALGGAAVGGAAYEAEKHHHHHHHGDSTTGEPDTMKPLPVAPGNHGIGTGEGTQNALLDRGRGEGYGTTGTTGTTLGDRLHGTERNRGIDAGVDDGTTGYGSTTGTTGHHHLGRDAAIGAGGVGLAEHEHRKHEREREAGVGGTGLGSNTGTYGDDTTTGTGTTGHHHHLGRDAAVGAGGVGLAEHEHRKHEREREAGTYGDNTTTTGGHHHLGRDAAVGAGGVGAVGLAEHEHRKHEHGTTGTTGAIPTNYAGVGPDGQVVQPPGTTLADKLHGIERNRGINAGVDDGSTGYGSTMGSTGAMGTTGGHHHLGRDTAIGAGGVGLAEHEHRKHEREREGFGSNTYGDDTTAAGTGTGHHHHLGRDAAIGAGGGGLAEHEHRKHERERETGVGSDTGMGYGTNDPVTSMLGANTESERSAGYVAPGTERHHNVLHKDPPPGHPASGMNSQNY